MWWFIIQLDQWFSDFLKKGINYKLIKYFDKQYNNWLKASEWIKKWFIAL